MTGFGVGSKYASALLALFPFFLGCCGYPAFSYSENGDVLHLLMLAATMLAFVKYMERYVDCISFLLVYTSGGGVRALTWLC